MRRQANAREVYILYGCTAKRTENTVRAYRNIRNRIISTVEYALETVVLAPTVACTVNRCALTVNISIKYVITRDIRTRILHRCKVFYRSDNLIGVMKFYNLSRAVYTVNDCFIGARCKSAVDLVVRIYVCAIDKDRSNFFAVENVDGNFLACADRKAAFRYQQSVIACNRFVDIDYVSDLLNAKANCFAAEGCRIAYLGRFVQGIAVNLQHQIDGREAFEGDIIIINLIIRVVFIKRI